jgi:hypothetical protein
MRMATHHKLLGAFALGLSLTVTASLSAQIQAGLLGRRTVGLSGFAEDLRTAGIGNGSGALLGVNLPLGSNADFGFSGSYESIPTNSFQEKQAFASLTAYRELNGFKPFVDVSIGNIWQSSSVGAFQYSDNKAAMHLAPGRRLRYPMRLPSSAGSAITNISTANSAIIGPIPSASTIG